MKRELLSKAFGDIDERFILEAFRGDPGAAASPPERIVHMKKKRFITLALAAALLLALGITAYAVWSIHDRRQQELKADLKIEENHVGSYVEYNVADEDAKSGVTLLSTVNDGDAQRVFVNVSPVERADLDRFPSPVSFAWRLDGMTVGGTDYWMTAGPKLNAGSSVSGREAILEAILRDAYDESTKTLTLECFISNNAIAQAQAYEHSDRVHLTVTLWDHQAQADAHVGTTVEWLSSQKSFGSVWFTPTEQEQRFFDFDHRRYHDEELDMDIELIGLELTPFGAVWQVSYPEAAAFHADGADWAAFPPYSVLEERVCIEGQLIFSDGSAFSTGGSLTGPYENGAVNLHCGWDSAIDINDVQRIVLGDTVLWEAK